MWRGILDQRVSSDALYIFSRRFYPKRLTVHSGYTFFCQYMCSLGIEPITFALLTQCSTTEPQEHRFATQITFHKINCSQNNISHSDCLCCPFVSKEICNLCSDSETFIYMIWVAILMIYSKHQHNRKIHKTVALIIESVGGNIEILPCSHLFIFCYNTEYLHIQFFYFCFLCFKTLLCSPRMTKNSNIVKYCNVK